MYFGMLPLISFGLLWTGEIFNMFNVFSNHFCLFTQLGGWLDAKGPPSIHPYRLMFPAFPMQPEDPVPETYGARGAWVVDYHFRVCVGRQVSVRLWIARTRSYGSNHY